MKKQELRPDDFEFLLMLFNDLVKEMPPKEKIKKELLELKARTNKSDDLNLRQKEAVIARIDNYLTDNYGNSKQGVTFKTT